MVDIRFDLGALLKDVKDIQNHTAAISRLMPVVGEILATGVSDVYEAEGPGWAPLKESTLLARSGSSHKILQDTGLMAGSTNIATGGDWAEAYAGVSYAYFHADGTKNMSARNPFDLGPFEEEVLADVSDLILAEVVK